MELIHVENLEGAAGAAQPGESPDALMPALAAQLGAEAPAVAALRQQQQQTAGADYRKLKATLWPLADTAEALASTISHYEARRPPARGYRQHEALLRALRQEFADMQARLRGKPVAIARLPAGEYRVQVVEADVDHRGSLRLVREISGGDLGGCRFEQVLGMKSRSEDIASRARKALRELCEAIGLHGLIELAQLHGKPHRLVVSAAGISSHPLLAAAA